MASRAPLHPKFVAKPLLKAVHLNLVSVLVKKCDKELAWLQQELFANVKWYKPGKKRCVAKEDTGCAAT